MTRRCPSSWPGRRRLLAAWPLRGSMLPAGPSVKREGNALAATVTLPPWATQYVGMTAVSAGLMLPAVQKVREAASRAQTSNNLKQIALAIHNYEATYNHLPPAALVDKTG